jgi:general secretion pathway protein D
LTNRTPWWIALRAGGAPAVAALLAACAPLSPNIPAPLRVPGAAASAPVNEAVEAPRALRTSSTPVPPVQAAPAEPAPAKAAAGDATVAAVNLQQVALPTFVQLVYAEVIKKNVNLHPSVVQRQDLVTFRTGPDQTAEQVEQAVRLVLKSYGLSAVDVGGVVRVLPDNAALGDLPAIRYGAASPEVPLPLRPIFHLVPLQAVRQTDVTVWLRTMFGDRVTVMEDAGRNAVLLRGNPDNVQAAMEAIAALDQPAMKGRASVALSPAFWSAEELARRLAEVLAAEGYTVHPVGNPVTPGAARAPVILLPVSALNTVYVFATTDAVAAHVSQWAKALDRPADRGIGKNFFSYAVKHKDAEALAGTLDRLLSGGGSSATTTPATGAKPEASASTRLNSVVVDKATNTLIFQAKPEEYGQLTGLLQMLDRPSRAALIEVTVAELTLNDSTEIGVDLLASRIEAGGGYRIGTSAGGSATGALSINVFNGLNVPKLALSALATDNRATILSSPRLMARNGESATIQVGQEVPIVSQQQATGVTTSTSNGLLTTVQYRSTGVILKIKPVIHSGDQIDLDVQQEVSEAINTTTGVTSSPTIQQRKVDTKLTLRSGATVLLGGLISNTGSEGKNGVPLLKDIPVVGNLFSKQTRSERRTELVVLITAYIANDTHEAEAITEAFRKSLGSWAQQPAALRKAAEPAEGASAPPAP